MPTLLLYLLKVNVALVLFYLAYHLVLRRLTFYHLNRLFLVFAVLFSSLYPFVDLAELFGQQQELVSAYAVTVPAHWMTATNLPAQEAAFDYWQIPIILFWAGVAVMAFRLLLQFVSLYRIHTSSEPKAYKSISFRQIRNISQAFSFWQTIYLNPAQHRNEELEAILRHEQIHVRGWHTLDVLLAELSTVFYWFNPGVWLMKKAIKENLEFIADQHVVNAGVDRKAYQYLILKALAVPEPQLANRFNFPSLKRRIAMMNKVPTKRTHQLRLLIALPLAAVLLVAFRNTAPLTEAITSAATTETTQQDGNNKLPKELVELLLKNPAVKNVKGKIVENRNAIVINLKGGGTEVYYLDSTESIAALKRKYELPELPPPPPPAPAAPDAEPLPAPPAPDAEQLPVPPPPAPDKLEAHFPEGVVYYIDGEEDKTQAYKQIDPKQIHSINVYKGESAQKVFGKKAAKGVISITTEKNKDSRQVQEFRERFPALPTPPPPPAATKINPAHSAFMERNPSVSNMYWTTIGETGKEQKVTGLILKLKSGKTENYSFSDGESMNLFREKYGELPKIPESLQLPTPPPPVREEQLPPPPPPVRVDADEAFTYVMGVTDAYYQNEANLPEDHKAFLKRNPEVKHVGFKFNNRKEFDLLSFVVYLKSGGVEEYKYNGSKTIPAAESKYGKLPGLPAPPPPTRAK